MIALVLLATATPSWTAVDLDKFRAPITMFFCKNENVKQGVASVFLRHDPSKSIVDLGRYGEPNAEIRLKENVTAISTLKVDDQRTDVRISTASIQGKADLIIHLGSSPLNADLSWEQGGDVYVGNCTSVPVPPGKTE